MLESAAQNSLAVEVNHLVKTYPMGDGPLTVLNDISFTIRAGELVGVVGESGSGKSTLLHILGALDSPTSGSVRVGGINPFAGKDGPVSHFRSRYIGFVFQHNNLLPEFTCEENVMMPGLIAGFPSGQVRERAQDLLKTVGLSHRTNHYPGMMSGGEQQRTALARALINNPTLLLADEPSGNLDSVNASKVHNLFRDLQQKYGTTILVVTHNLEFARQLPRVLEMRDGQFAHN
jgi:ABC-type lipoprotein export system ATPase subunit